MGKAWTVFVEDLMVESLRDTSSYGLVDTGSRRRGRWRFGGKRCHGQLQSSTMADSFRSMGGGFDPDDSGGVLGDGVAGDPQLSIIRTPGRLPGCPASVVLHN